MLTKLSRAFGEDLREVNLSLLPDFNSQRKTKIGKKGSTYLGPSDSVEKGSQNLVVVSFKSDKI